MIEGRVVECARSIIRAKSGGVEVSPRCSSVSACCVRTRTPLRFVVLAAWLLCLPARGITFSPFGVQGQGGSRNSQNLTIGAGGSVYEIDSFLYAAGLDLNGTNEGVSARLSVNTLLTEIVFSFRSDLSADSTDLLLTYSFTNSGSEVFRDLRFFSFLDAEIDQASNTFFNEYGVAAGSPGSGIWDSDPDLWQISEPGFLDGTLYGNLLVGILDNTNAVPASLPDDVSMALGFRIGDLKPGQARSVRVLISEDADVLGSLALIHRDADSNSGTFITFSGQADVGPRELTNLMVTGASQITSGQSGSYTSIACFSDSSFEDVSATATWGMQGWAPAGTAFSGSFLTAGNVSSSTPITIAAEYACDGVTRTGTMAVTISPAGLFRDVATNVLLAFTWQLNRQTGTMFGSLTITNPGSSPNRLSQPFWLCIHDSIQFRFMHRDGEMPDADDYVDLTDEIETALSGTGNRDLILDPGESVVVTDIEVYSRMRVMPPTNLFELWMLVF